MTDTPTLVSEAMIEAGIKSMRWQYGPPQSDDAQMVKGIYLAMSAAADPPSVDEVKAVTSAIEDAQHDDDCTSGRVLATGAFYGNMPSEIVRDQRWPNMKYPAQPSPVDNRKDASHE